MTKGKTSATINSLLKLASLSFKLGEGNAGEANTDQLSFLVFEIGADNFAISVEQIEGIVDSPRITPLPNAPDSVSGVTSVRGRMTLTISLGSPEMVNRHKQRLILLKGDAQLGLLADRIDDVITVLTKDVQKRARRKKGQVERESAIVVSTDYLKHKDRLIPILDIEQIEEA